MCCCPLYYQQFLSKPTQFLYILTCLYSLRLATERCQDLSWDYLYRSLIEALSYCLRKKERPFSEDGSRACKNNLILFDGDWSFGSYCGRACLQNSIPLFPFYTQNSLLNFFILIIYRRIKLFIFCAIMMILYNSMLFKVQRLSLPKDLWIQKAIGS